MDGKLLSAVDAGIVVLDAKFRVVYWNRWMELKTRIAAETIVGCDLNGVYEGVRMGVLGRRIRQVICLGTPAFIEARTHGYIFPVVISTGKQRELMRQNVSIALLPGTKGHVCLTITDATDFLRDALTGLFARAHLLGTLDAEFERARRGEHPLSILMLDVDHFKAVNDTHGHLVGDEVLTTLAQRLRDDIRVTDFVGRYGGEEFMVVLSNTGRGVAEQVADRVRMGVRAQPFCCTPNLKLEVRVSIGVATLRSDENRKHLLERADRALYRAKELGRDRVCVAFDDELQQAG